MSNLEIIVATKNQHKLAEIRAILDHSSSLKLFSLSDFPEIPEIIEDQDSFVGNASKKALETAKILQRLVLADDSGLCVDALQGAPGVHSARYAGPGANSSQLCQKLIINLHHIPSIHRTARFTTVLALATPQKVLFTVEGSVDGLIIDQMRGTNGFGYDPVFLYPHLGKTFAELSPVEKNQLSHRARALAALKTKLQNI